MNKGKEAAFPKYMHKFKQENVQVWTRKEKTKREDEAVLALCPGFGKLSGRVAIFIIYVKWDLQQLRTQGSQ